MGKTDKEVYDAITSPQNWRPTPMRKILKQVGIKSIGGVHKSVQRLKDAGLLGKNGMPKEFTVTVANDEEVKVCNVFNK